MRMVLNNQNSLDSCLSYFSISFPIMKQSKMYIHLNELKIYAYHGVLPQENKVGAEYILNLKLKTDFSRASQMDDLTYTINYAEVFQAVNEEMQIPSHLLEHVIQRIAKRLFHDFPALTEINITLFKQNPPMGADCRETGVESTFTKN